MKKFMFTAAVVAFSLYATAQEKADSAKIDILLLPNVELNEVNVLGTWAQKNDPIAQINLTEKDVEALEHRSRSSLCVTRCCRRSEFL
jgi:hypothetical protein